VCSSDLSEHVCFALYTASRTVINRYRPLLDEIGITYPQYLALLVLWEHGDTTVRDLGAALQLDSSTLSPLLKRLAAAGLVTRSRLASDERSVLVSLTPQGSDLRDRAESVATAVACEFDLSLEDLAAYATPFSGSAPPRTRPPPPRSSDDRPEANRNHRIRTASLAPSDACTAPPARQKSQTPARRTNSTAAHPYGTPTYGLSTLLDRRTSDGDCVHR